MEALLPTEVHEVVEGICAVTKGFIALLAGLVAFLTILAFGVLLAWFNYLARRRRLTALAEGRDAQGAFDQFVRGLSGYPEASIRELYQALQSLIDLPGFPVLPEDDLEGQLEIDPGNIVDWLETRKEQKRFAISFDETPPRALAFVRYLLENESPTGKGKER